MKVLENEIKTLSTPFITFLDLSLFAKKLNIKQKTY